MIGQQKKILFLDRDGTLIIEPDDKVVDSIDKLEFLPGVIPSLLKLQQAGYTFVMVTNQDGLGTPIFPKENFLQPHNVMLKVFQTQGILFEDVRICPHMPDAGCDCRKPKVGLILDYLNKQLIDLAHSYVIGDRETDLQLAKNMGISGIRFGQAETSSWEQIVHKILTTPRLAMVTRKTKETEIEVIVDLDRQINGSIHTGISFFDHMLEQLAKHGGFGLTVLAKGDLHIDEHHTVEDTALTLGEAMRKALGDKVGIGRYGFLLPMDESLAQIALDLGGRPYCVFKADFKREKVGELSTELIPHFFQSFAQTLGAALHIEVVGENTHHMIEATFKGVGRALRQALTKVDSELPSTKGLL